MWSRLPSGSTGWVRVPFAELGSTAGDGWGKGSAEGMGRIGHIEFEVLHRYFWNLPEKKKLKLKGGITCVKYLGALSRCSINASFYCYAVIVILLFLS